MSDTHIALLDLFFRILDSPAWIVGRLKSGANALWLPFFTICWAVSKRSMAKFAAVFPRLVWAGLRSAGEVLYRPGLDLDK